jgi:hypothetical protein
VLMKGLLKLGESFVEVAFGCRDSLGAQVSDAFIKVGSFHGESIIPPTGEAVHTVSNVARRCLPKQKQRRMTGVTSSRDELTMTNEERQRMVTLCRQIAVEDDYCEMIVLVRELNAVLETKDQRLTPPSTGVSQSNV